MNSGRIINYTLRPAKCIERKIMCEFITKFNTATPIHKYRYIGFGSFYFSDFVLFHNALNINKMISIENSTNRDRYDFNKPYKCIDMFFGTAGEALTSGISFSDEIKDIIWLDYDSNFTHDTVSDLISATNKLSIGSFLFVSFNSSIPEDNDKCKLPYIEENFKNFMPKIGEKDIEKKTIPKILHYIIDTAIKNTLSARNINEGEPIVAKPIFYIKYKDNAEMLTLGYYFGCESEIENMLNQDITTFPWYAEDDNPYTLKVPCFTKAEIREINKMLPGSSVEEISRELTYLNVNDIKKYIDLYKYYPNFLDSQYYV